MNGSTLKTLDEVLKGIKDDTLSLEDAKEYAVYLIKNCPPCLGKGLISMQLAIYITKKCEHKIIWVLWKKVICSRCGKTLNKIDSDINLTIEKLDRTYYG